MDETRRIDNAKIAAAGLFQALPTEGMGGWSPPEWAGAGDENLLQLAAKLAMGTKSARPVAFDRPRKSIFSALKMKGARGSDAYHPLEPLALREEALFPLESPPKITETEAQDRIWTPLAHDLEDLDVQAGDPVTYVESAYLLLRRYTWNVPAPYEGMEEVSFYDFARLTAAMAVCLQNRKDSDPVAYLVSGDVSGVQQFIYTITSKGAASALRGRSFYLQLLTEAVARYLLREADLPATNLLYVGGGGFAMLIPANSLKNLQEAGREVDQVFLDHHAGDLYLAIAHVPLEEPDFLPGAISSRWNELAMEHRKAKQRRFASLGEEGLERLFTPQEHGGNEEKLCQVCGREHPGTKEVKIGPDEEPVRKCPPCVSYEDLGRDLRRARFLRLDEIPAQFQQGGPPGEYEQVLAAFGMAAEVDESVPPASPGTIRSLVLALRDDAVKELHPEATVAVGRRFLVNVTPEVTQADVDWANKNEERRSLLKGLAGDPVGRIKPFDFMAARSEGIKRLGILRMDVDDMGEMFVSGFGDKATLAHIASLSFAMSLFFEGWVEKLAEDVDGGKNLVYSIYSGGDDLFFVGAWHLMPELARRIRVDLGRYAGGHPGVHASGGIVLVQQKYPLAQGAEDAGGAEEAAKSLEDKDAIAFLGRAVHWKAFGLDSNDDTVLAMKEELVRLGAPSVLLRRLVRWQLMYEDTAGERRKAGIPEDKSFWGPWMWHAAYFLKRMEEAANKGGNKDLADELRELREEKLGTLQFSRNIEWIGLAARWAELLTRGVGRKEA